MGLGGGGGGWVSILIKKSNTGREIDSLVLMLTQQFPAKEREI